MLLATVVAVCVASHAAASAATVPLPDKIYYDLDDAKNLFKDHVKTYQRKYDGEEYNKRFEIFKENLKKLNEMNAKYPRTVFGVTRFTDLTPEEIRNSYGLKPLNKRKEENENIIQFPRYVKSKKLPDSFDWRDHGAVTPAKNQHMCSSHVFSAIGSIEGQYAVKHKQCIAFSEQQCLDCLPDINCDFVTPDVVMNALAKRAGCMKESDYPYEGIDGQQCEEKADKIVAKVIGATKLNITTAEDLRQALYNIGPLSVLMDPLDLSTYWGGILIPRHCSSDPKYAVHAALLVGWGHEYYVPYWIIKDSSGVKGYREDPGYIRVISDINACGVEGDGVYAAQVA